MAPPMADKGWAPVVGEIVEVSEDDCWWEAFVEELVGKNKLKVKFRVSDEIKPPWLIQQLRLILRLCDSAWPRCLACRPQTCCSP